MRKRTEHVDRIMDRVRSRKRKRETVIVNPPLWRPSYISIPKMVPPPIHTVVSTEQQEETFLDKLLLRIFIYKYELLSIGVMILGWSLGRYFS